jgi:hypothetical protein
MQMIRYWKDETQLPASNVLREVQGQAPPSKRAIRFHCPEWCPEIDE